MRVSWNWLKEYVRLDMPLEELTRRLTMAGLNHEGTEEVGGDLAIELEVTSNRPDCLSHLGIAREAAVLLDRSVSVPAASPPEGSAPAESLTSVKLECPDLCPRYTARVIQGAKVTESPDWLRRRLETVGISSINNVVDVTNYVLLECSQPLHAFDFDKLAGRRIVVRRARRGETMVAINQRRYELTPQMCVIADAERPVAIGGVMGGLETEVSHTTTNLLIESAQFDPLSIRNTSRALALQSESSFRFERGVDPEGVDWASRRACELILELAGGELARGVVYAGPRPEPRSTIPLRFRQLRRVLGIDIDPDEARSILQKLGLAIVEDRPERIVIRPPSWRGDLTREIDLVEEVGRIHGYDAVPETSRIPVAPVSASARQRVQTRVRELLCAAGFDEAVSFSLVDEHLVKNFRLWSQTEAMQLDHPSWHRERSLRQSLLPSLISAWRHNAAHGHPDTDLFEIARVYLPGQAGLLPDEPILIGLVSARNLLELKGACEALVEGLRIHEKVEARSCDANTPAFAIFATNQGAELWLGGQLWGYFGRLSDTIQEQFDLRQPCSVAELLLAPLEALARFVPRYEPLTPYPAIERELSLVLDEAVTWQELEQVVRSTAGPMLEAVDYLDMYRGPQIPAGKKSLHFRLVYRAADRTLTNEEVESFQHAVISGCAQRFGAILRT